MQEAEGPFFLRSCFGESGLPVQDYASFCRAPLLGRGQHVITQELRLMI